MEAQPFFNTIAGLAVSLAGFGALIAWLRDDPRAWDPINLWRLKTIVRHALTLAFIALSLVPVFSLSGSVDLTIRWGSIALIAAEILDLFLNRKPDPEIWPERLSWRANVAAGGVHGPLANRQPVLGQRRSAPNRCSHVARFAGWHLLQLCAGDRSPKAGAPDVNRVMVSVTTSRTMIGQR